MSRAGVVLACLRVAVVATVIAAFIAVPSAVVLRLLGCTRALAIAEVVLVIPYLFSPALRLHSLKELLSIGDPISAALGLHRVLSHAFLFTDASVILGLVYSYAALLSLPVIHALRQLPESIRMAGFDVGMSVTRRVVLLVRLSSGSIVAGLFLMCLCSWFSSLEHEILGKSTSILVMLNGLLGVQNDRDAAALAMIPFGVSTLGVIIALRWVRVERFLAVGGA